MRVFEELKEGLRELSGRNIALEIRYAEGNLHRTCARGRTGPAQCRGNHNLWAARTRAASEATRTIPIFMGMGRMGDANGYGFFGNLARTQPSCVRRRDGGLR